ncbi:hypothetical protein F3K43_42590 [Streptomyces sp. LBUM 1476]|nr:hypothetical protein [Streptomyces sp. LBUM 1476]
MAEGQAADRLHTGSTPRPGHGGEPLAGRGSRTGLRGRAAPTGEEPYVSVSRLLLLYRLRRRSAKAIRICFYAALGFMGFVVIAMLNDAASRRTVGWNVSLLVLTGVLALLLRFWAVSTDSRDQN